MSTYKITRRYFKGHDAEIIAEGLTLEKVKAHCKDPETSSQTATAPDALERTEKLGPWFDGYEEE